MGVWNKILAASTACGVALAAMTSMIVSAQTTSAADFETAQVEGIDLYGNGMVYNGHVYQLFHESNISWYDAEMICEAMDGHLATITSAGEQQAIESLLDDYGQLNNYWAGMFKTSGAWTWVTGEPASYTNWATGEPNNDENTSENVLQLYATYYDEGDYAAYLGEWNDQTNTGSSGFHALSETGFICEWDDILLGDVNLDGKVDIADAYLTLMEYSQASAGLEMSLTIRQEVAADVDFDNCLSILDAYDILMYYAIDAAGGNPSWN